MKRAEREKKRRGNMENDIEGKREEGSEKGSIKEERKGARRERNMGEKEGWRQKGMGAYCSVWAA